MPRVIIYANEIPIDHHHQIEWERMLEQIISKDKLHVTFITADIKALQSNIDKTNLTSVVKKEINYCESKEAFNIVSESKDAVQNVIIMAPSSGALKKAEAAGKIVRYVEANDFASMRKICGHYGKKSSSPEYEDIQSLYLRLYADLLEYNSCTSFWIAKETLEAQIAFLKLVMELADKGHAKGEKLECVKEAKSTFEKPDSKCKFKYSDVAVTFFCNSTPTGNLVNKIIESPTPKVV